MYGIEEEMCGTAWRDAYGWTWLHEDAEQQEWNMADWMADVALRQMRDTLEALGYGNV